MNRPLREKQAQKPIPHPDEALEASIWHAVWVEPRNWTPKERGYIQARQDLIDELLEWLQSPASKGCISKANQRFIKFLPVSFVWAELVTAGRWADLEASVDAFIKANQLQVQGKACTDSLTGSGADLLPTSRTNAQEITIMPRHSYSDQDKHDLLSDIYSEESSQRPIPLTDKELYVVDAFESARPGLGEIAENNIRNPNSGWQESIADMDESEIVCREGTSSNNGFMYRHMGH